MADWNIHHCDREYAQSVGDPVIGTVSADTKLEAERIAFKQFSLYAGAWAVEQPVPIDKKHQPERLKSHDHVHTLEP